MKLFKGSRSLIVAFAFASLIFSTHAELSLASPSTIMIQGKLTNAAALPLTGNRAWRVQFYSASSGGSAVGASVQGIVTVAATGRFSIELTPPSQVFGAGALYYELAIDSATTPDGKIDNSDVFPGRVKVASVMYAQDAKRLGGNAANTFATTASLATGLAGKANLNHSHAISALSGQITQAQVPGGLVVNAAGTANNALRLGGVAPSGYATTTTLATALAAKADGNHNHILSALSGRITQAQLPAGLAVDTAQTANNALRLGGVAPSGYATTTTLSTALAAKADLNHNHTLSALSGQITQAQVPGWLIVNNAVTADNASRLGGIASSGYTTSATLTAALANKAGLTHTHSKGDLTNQGTLGFEWQDGEVANNLTIQGGNVSNDSFDAYSNLNAAGRLNNDAPADLLTRSQSDDHYQVLRGESYVIVKTSSNLTSNGLALQAAYAVAKTLTPHAHARSAGNRVVVLVPPGRYSLGTGQFLMDTEFVDVVGLSGVRDDQVITGVTAGAGTGVLCQTADNVRIANLIVECTYTAPGGVSQQSPAAYYPNDAATTDTIVQNCEFKSTCQNRYCTRVQISYPGTYRDCKAGDYAFGSFLGNANGTFENCTAGYCSFGGLSATASGTFKNCTGGDYSFGGYSGQATGTFTNCIGGDFSFGSSGIASGTFFNCTGGTNSFGSYYGTASGNFTNCTGGIYSFGGNYGIASGTFTNCTGGEDAFGGAGGNTLNAKLYGCRFTAAWNGTWAGLMQDCYWGTDLKLSGTARLYSCTVVGTIDLQNNTAGVTQCRAKNIINLADNIFGATNAAAFNSVAAITR